MSGVYKPLNSRYIKGVQYCPNNSGFTPPLSTSKRCTGVDVPMFNGFTYNLSCKEISFRFQTLFLKWLQANNLKRQDASLNMNLQVF